MTGPALRPIATEERAWLVGCMPPESSLRDALAPALRKLWVPVVGSAGILIFGAALVDDPAWPGLFTQHWPEATLLALMMCAWCLAVDLYGGLKAHRARTDLRDRIARDIDAGMVEATERSVIAALRIDGAPGEGYYWLLRLEEDGIILATHNAAPDAQPDSRYAAELHPRERWSMVRAPSSGAARMRLSGAPIPVEPVEIAPWDLEHLYYEAEDLQDPQVGGATLDGLRAGLLDWSWEDVAEMLDRRPPTRPA